MPVCFVLLLLLLLSSVQSRYMFHGPTHGLTLGCHSDNPVSIIVYAESITSL